MRIAGACSRAGTPMCLPQRGSIVLSICRAVSAIGPRPAADLASCSATKVTTFVLHKPHQAFSDELASLGMSLLFSNKVSPNVILHSILSASRAPQDQRLTRSYILYVLSPTTPNNSYCQPQTSMLYSATFLPSLMARATRYTDAHVNVCEVAIRTDLEPASSTLR